MNNTNENNETSTKPKNKRRIIIIASAAVLVIAVIIAATLLLPLLNKNKKSAEADIYYSPSSISAGGEGIVYVSDATANIVTKYNSDGTVAATYNTKTSANKVLVSDGKVYVLEGGLAGNLLILSEDLDLISTIDVGHTPMDMVINGETAYVCNRFSNTVSVIDLNSTKVTETIEVGREPSSMTIAGDELYVGCFLTKDASDSDTVSTNVDVISLETNKVTDEIKLVNGSQSLRGLCTSPDGARVYATHLISRYEYPTSQLDRGWINTNGFTIIDTKTHENFAVLLDEVESGAANPWDVVCSEDGNTLYFSLSGTQEIMSVDVSKLNDRISNVSGSKDVNCKSVNDIVNYIPFLSGTQKRLRMSGNGIRDMELSDGKLYVAQYFTGNIAVINTESYSEVAVISAENQPEVKPARLGESLWYDADYCYQSWESCNSCHPDGRADSLNWDNLNDGLGNPKNTKSMMFSHRTPPEMVTGARPSAEIAVRKGMLFIQYNVLDETKLCAIDEYLKSMLPVESPYLNRDGTYTDAALRGKELFETQGCSECHPAPLYTDLSAHTSPYLGSDGSWENRDFDTPTLVEIWRSAPYTYSGGITSIKDIIKKFAPDLTDEQISDLEKFVLSIGVVDEKFGVEEVFASDTDKNDYICLLKPGTTLDRFTVRKQDSDAGSCEVTVKLCSPDGKEIKKDKFKPEDSAYNTAVSVELGWEIPGDIAEGSYLEITITDKSGNEIAAPYRLYYHG